MLGEIDPAAHSSAVGYFVRTGTRDEERIDMGVSHFLEHMLFKGTDDLDADALNRAFDAMGARHNAYTSSEQTCYHAQVVPERAGEAIELIGRMLRPALRDADFDTEKGVILEEIAMYDDEPFWVLYEKVAERFYEGHPLGYRTLGTKESITALTSGQMRAYFDRRYAPDNVHVALAGRIDFDRACEQIERLTSAWTPSRDAHARSTPGATGGRFDVRDDKVSRGYVLSLAAAPSAQDERRYAAALASQALGAPGNSRLHWSLIEPGIAEEAQASYDPHDGCGAWFVFASGEPERIDEVWDVCVREAKGLADAITQDDLERLRAKIRTGVTIGGERPSDRMQRLGRMRCVRSDYLSLEDELASLARVTLKDVRDVLAAFPIERSMVGTLRPAT